jgi:LysM repeat protein
LKLTRLAPLAAPCLAAAVLLAACGGGGSSGNNPSDVSKIATATLPAKLPDPKILTGGVVQSGSTSGRYTIKSGDTLSAIAASFGVTLDDLLSANPGIDPTGLRAGDTIRLPDTTAPPPTAAAPKTSPTPAAATAVLPTEPPATAPPATEPPAPPTDTPAPALPTDTPAPGVTPTPSSLGQTYTVQAGDIPETIAAKFGITIDALLAANPGIDPTNLQIGQVLVIPPKPNP